MKFLKINDCEVAYKEFNSHLQETIIFIHGNSHSSATFIHQQSEKCFSRFRLIFIDLPGHGDSNSLDSYSLPIYANMVKDFIIKLGLVRYAIVGHSLGGHIGVQILNEINPLGIFIIGTPPQKKPFSGQGFLSNSYASILNQPTANDEELQALSQELHYDNIETSQFIIDYKKTDPNFRVQIIPSVLRGDFEDEVLILQNFQGVKFGLCSKSDRLISSDYMEEVLHEVNGTFYLLDGGHSCHCTSAIKFNKLLNLFADKVFINHNSFLINGSEMIEVFVGN